MNKKAEELKPDEIIQIHGKHLLTVYVDRRKRLVLPRKTARKLLHQQAQKSYSQGREEGIREGKLQGHCKGCYCDFDD